VPQLSNGIGDEFMHNSQFRTLDRCAVRPMKLALFLCILLLGTTAFGQTNPKTQLPLVKPAQPPPRTELYWYFFRLQSRIDREANLREKNGKDGAGLRNHFRQKLQFTETEFASMRETGLRIDSQIKVVDAKVKDFIKAYRQQNPLPAASDAVARPIPPEIKAFTKECDSIIENEVARLKEFLNPEHAAKLENFVTTQLVTHSVVQHANPDFRRKQPQEFHGQAHP
jgi:hypothetical protein